MGDKMLTALQHIHATLHGVGLICAIVGIVAVFRFHNEHKITDLYSLHSWLGMFVLVLFSLNVRSLHCPVASRVYS